MAYVLSSVSGNLISAASAGFAPTNSADVSAIASAYQVVSSTATQLYAGTAYVTSINEAPISASRAGNAANASLATSAYYDGTGRLISALPDSAAVSAIASSYAESAASGKQDTLTFGYDTSDKISSINGSSLAGEGGGLVTALGTGQDPWYQSSVSSINGMNLSARWAVSASNATAADTAKSANFANTAHYAESVAPSAISAFISGVASRSGTIIVTNRTGIDATDSAVVGEYVPGYSGISTYAGNLIPFNSYDSAIFTGIPDSLPVTLSLAMLYGSPETITFSGSNGTTASASYAGSPTALTAYLGNVSSVYIYTQSEHLQQDGLTYTADSIDNASIVALAHASALPTYQYDAENKISSIDGSAIAGGMDSAACSAIASAYAESAASSKLDATASSSFYPADNPSGFISSVELSDYATTSYVDSSISGFAYESAVSAWTAKQDALTYGYNTANQISSIDGSALGGMDEAAVSGIASAYAESAASSKLDTTAYNSADFYSTSNPSGFIDSAYVDSAVSSKADSSALSSYVPYSSLEYNTASAISGINGSALAAGSTYSAGEGIDITDDVISVEAPVDIVAGPGIVIDNPDGNTLRVSMAADYETVLWSGYSTGSTPVFNLSDDISAFSYIEFYAVDDDGWCGYTRVGSDYCTTANRIPITIGHYGLGGKNFLTRGIYVHPTANTGLDSKSFGFDYVNNCTENNKTHMTKIVGINRINGGN